MSEVVTTIPEDLLAAIAEKSAKLTNQGVGINKQAEELTKEFNVPVTRTKLLSLKNHPKYASTLMEIAEAGKLQLRAGISGLVPDLIKCLGGAFKEGGQLGVRAAAIGASVLINKDSGDEQKQAQSIQVILPTTSVSPKPDHSS